MGLMSTNQQPTVVLAPKPGRGLEGEAVYVTYTPLNRYFSPTFFHSYPLFNVKTNPKYVSYWYKFKNK